MSQPLFWQSQNPRAWVLWPVSQVWRLGNTVNQWCQKRVQEKLNIPVICIGNINVGGVGKTPVVAWLAAHLAAQGKQVAVISKGYGGYQRTPWRVQANDPAHKVGDEPAMLAQQLAHLPVHVWVGKNRAATAQRAQQAGAHIIVLDDGFQNQKLHKDIQLVVTDGTQGFGNGFCLPAGGLREPVSALARADALLVMNGDTRLIKPHDLPPKLPIIRLRTAPDAATVKRLKNKKLLAFAGIGIPQKFFHSLKRAGLNVVEQHPFPDHHTFTEEELSNLQTRARNTNATLVCTAKDAVKLTQGFPATIVPQTVQGDGLKQVEALLTGNA